LHGTLIKRSRQLLAVFQGGFFPNPGMVSTKKKTGIKIKRE
jgi:hypothetical protein